MRTIEITENKIDEIASNHFEGIGGEVRFVGVVRKMEKGKSLSGIRYTCYRPMTDKVLSEISDEGLEKFGDHSMKIIHKIGFTPIAEPSILIEVGFAHSAEAFEACHWYLKQIKTRVPIWKEPVF